MNGAVSYMLVACRYRAILTSEKDKRAWDYSALFRGRSNRYRLLCNVVFSAFAQWAGKYNGLQGTVV